MKMVMIPVSSGGSYFLLVFFVSFVLVLVFPPFIFLSLSISLCLTLPYICPFPWLFFVFLPLCVPFFRLCSSSPCFSFIWFVFLALSLSVFFCSPLFFLSPSLPCARLPLPSFYKARDSPGGGNGRPPKCSVTDAFNEETYALAANG